jgi:hypothetical protein
MATRNVLKDRYRRVMDRVASAAARTGRKPSDILVVAVTKTASPDHIRQIIEMGHVDLGENRVQQLQQRLAMTGEFMARHRLMGPQRDPATAEKIRWHMIGHLQRNKVRPLIGHVKLIQSVDSLRLAEEIQAQASKLDHETEVLLQVNIAEEPQKAGLACPAVAHLADQILTMSHVKLRGLMAMAPYADDPEASRIHFQRMAEMFEEMRTRGGYGKLFNILSLGMSNDFEVGIECGANLVRIGRGIFGEGVPEASVGQA